MKKSYHFKNLIFGIIIALIMALFSGCRTVKKDVQKSEKETIENVDSSKTEKKDVKKDVRKFKTSKTANAKVKQRKSIKVEPIDTTKPIEVVDSKGETTKVFNGKVVFTDETETDNSIKETKTDSTANFTENSKTETTVNSEKKESQENENLNLDAKGGLFWVLLPYALWILLFLLLWIVWKNRKKIPYIKNLFS
jgi:hypothetical protein